MKANQSPFLSTLALTDLIFQVKLGYTEEERSSPQDVRFDVELEFPAPPQGCFNDQLTDTLCYDQMCKKIQQICHQKSYALIEHLAWSVFTRLKEDLGQEFKLRLKTTKVRPPIPGLQGGASFSMGDRKDPS